MAKSAQTPASTAAGAKAPVDEPDWGNTNKSQARKDTTRAERISGITWLTVGALFCLFVSVLYVGVRLPVGDSSIPFPWTVVFAFFMNRAITKTALLWTDNRMIAGIPVWVWIFGFVVLAAWPALPFGGDTLVAGNIWALALMISGAIGGMWPLLPQFSFDTPTVEQ